MSTLIKDDYSKPLLYQQYTTLTTATALSSIPTNATYALIIAEAQAVRWRDDGSDPTGSVGMPIAVGDGIKYTGNLSALKFIEQAVGGKINVAYYK